MNKQLEIIFNVSKKVLGNDFYKPGKLQENVFKRCVFYKACRELTNSRLVEIGKYVNKDHSTVVHGIKTFDREIKKDDNLLQYLELYETLHATAKGRIHRHFLKTTSKKELMEHIIINQRSRIVQLERILDNIPEIVKTKYA